MSPITPEDLEGRRTFVRGSEDRGYTGFAPDDGDVQNVFNVPGTSGNRLRGAGVSSVLAAIENGGDALDAYDGFLPDYYHQFGFVETGRLKFNRDYAPPKWDYERDGEPDVVLMAWMGFHEGDTPDAIATRTKLPTTFWIQHAQAPLYGEWDDAAAARGRILAGRAPNPERVLPSQGARADAAGATDDPGAGRDRGRTLAPSAQSIAPEPPRRSGRASMTRVAVDEDEIVADNRQEINERYSGDMALYGTLKRQENALEKMGVESRDR